MHNEVYVEYKNCVFARNCYGYALFQDAMQYDVDEVCCYMKFNENENNSTLSWIIHNLRNKYM